MIVPTLERVATTEINTPLLINVTAEASADIKERVEGVRHTVGEAQRDFSPVVVEFIADLEQMVHRAVESSVFGVNITQEVVIVGGLQVGCTAMIPTRATKLSIVSKSTLRTLVE